MGDVRSPRAAMLVAPKLAEYARVLCSSRCEEIQWRERGATRFGLSALDVAKKIYHSVASRFNEQVANDVARKVPSRVT